MKFSLILPGLFAATVFGIFVFVEAGLGTEMTGILYLVPAIPWCAWLLNGLFIFKVGLAAWSWQASQRRGLLSGRTLWGYVAVWLAGTLCLAALPLLFFFPLHQEPAGDPLDWVIHIGWLKYLFTLAALLLLPWARIGLAPLALASNRHR